MIWQLKDDELTPINDLMRVGGRTEVKDLEKWIRETPEILGEEIIIIGEQVDTKNGALDFLGIDKSGNLIVIELKRDQVPRKAIGQVIDYASNISNWTFEKLDRKCREFTKIYLGDYLKNEFPSINWENITINQSQRILFVGTSINDDLQNMIEWLSDNCGLEINFINFSYGKSLNGEEIIATTAIIPDSVAKKDKRMHIYDVEDHLKLFPKNIKGLYEDLDQKIKGISTNIVSKVNQMKSVTYYSPDRVFVHCIFQKQGLKLKVFTRGENIEGVKNFEYKKAGAKWGVIYLRNNIGINKTISAVQKSFELIKIAIQNNEKTGWFAELEEDEEETDFKDISV